MSTITSVGVYGPSYWAYMAGVMARRLEKMAQTGAYADAIPAAVFDDAKKFFRLVLEAREPAKSDNPAASINAYVIAAEALRRTRGKECGRDELEEELRYLAGFVRSLNQVRILDVRDRSSAERLTRFFYNTKRKGDGQVYGERMGFRANSPRGRYL